MAEATESEVSQDVLCHFISVLDGAPCTPQCGLVCSTCKAVWFCTCSTSSTLSLTPESAPTKRLPVQPPAGMVAVQMLTRYGSHRDSRSRSPVPAPRHAAASEDVVASALAVDPPVLRRLIQQSQPSWDAVAQALGKTALTKKVLKLERTKDMFEMCLFDTAIRVCLPLDGLYVQH